MRHAAFALLLALSLAGHAATAAAAAAEDAALAVVNRWMTAFAAGDVDTLVQLYAPDALFFGTGSRALVTDSAGIRAYFAQGAAANKPVGATLGAHTVRRLSPDLVLVTGLDQLVGERGGQRVTNDGRVSYLLTRRGSEWKILHFHRSAVPAP